MKVIYKYELEIVDRQYLELPNEYVILKVANQDGKLCLWAEVDNEYDERYLYPGSIWIVGTGQDLENVGGTYFDSVLMGSYVWHVYL